MLFLVPVPIIVIAVMVKVVSDKYKLKLLGTISRVVIFIGMVLFMNKQIYYYSSFGLQGVQTILLIVSAFMMMYKKDTQ